MQKSIKLVPFCRCLLQKGSKSVQRIADCISLSFIDSSITFQSPLVVVVSKVVAPVLISNGVRQGSAASQQIDQLNFTERGSSFKVSQIYCLPFEADTYTQSQTHLYTLLCLYLVMFKQSNNAPLVAFHFILQHKQTVQHN